MQTLFLELTAQNSLSMYKTVRSILNNDEDTASCVKNQSLSL